MQVEISKDIKIFEPTQDVLNWIDNNLIINNPIYQQMKILGKEDTIKWKHIPEKLNLYSKRYGTYVIPFGCLKALWVLLKQGDVKINFNNAGDISFKNDVSTINYYDYQERAIQYMVNAKGGVLVSPAGSGKTYMGIEIIKRIGKKALWICHTGDLLRQAKRDLLALYPSAKIGITTNGKLEIGEDITISTVQTLVNIEPKLYQDAFDVVMVDESVHCVSSPTQMKMFGEVVSSINARYKYGLTATPSRSDGMIKAMYVYLGSNDKGLFDATYKIDRSEVKTIEAIHQKYELVSSFPQEMMYEIYDTSGMLVYNKLIEYLSTNQERTNKICDNIKLCDMEGRKQVVLCSRVEHCEEIVKQLQAMGLKALLCVGKISPKKREEILKQEVEWDIIVATYSLLKEGVSVKDLDTLHLVTPMKDRATIVQCAGRIERFKENKKQPIIYDYVDIEIPYCEKVYNERRRALKKRF